ncbi:flagellar basal body P-ring formation chaperone FlgA, partial [Sulfuricurvum sp.]|uniref:flagellar basal body P-ring formation chaperone FlgA n=1 Tax=Sulfuricurvum sp. TaxID=2025608 RepID=UPI003BB6A46D
YRIDAHIIAKTFELNGIVIDISKIRFVNFTRKSLVDMTPAKTQLEKMLKEYYPSIKITSIFITPRGYLHLLNKEYRAIFDTRFYQNAKGTFYIVGSDGIRHYVDYSVKATLNVLHTGQNVNRKETLSGLNTILKQVEFTSFRDIPLTEIPIETFRFRSNLKANQLLTLRNIETTPLVLKNENVAVIVQSDGVIVEFGARATQEGSLYDIITVQKRDGKRVKTKVIGENRVELQ